ncbi:hypothetical protein Tco_1312536 [Tanacetum coccineum]
MFCQHLIAATYSASAEDIATDCYFIALQQTSLPLSWLRSDAVARVLTLSLAIPDGIVMNHDVVSTFCELIGAKIERKWLEDTEDLGVSYDAFC